MKITDLKFYKFSAVILLLTSGIVTAAPIAKLAGFKTSPYYNEQVVTFQFNDEIRIHINAPSVDSLKENQPLGLALFALPNGNTIEQTVGKILKTGDDWHYDIQHIGAQTRFLRQKISDYNLVVVYLETKQRSWPLWKSQHADYIQIVKSLVEYLRSCFEAYDPFLILTGHSGGGRFIFSFMDAFPSIPEDVKRICFLDSDYGYENSYGEKMIEWLNASNDHFLSVLAYNDSVALYNGKPVVSATGGTWYRSRFMQKYFSDFYTFTRNEDDEFITHSALNGRIQIFLKKNPKAEILHTIQVERNGFIHTMLTGTPLESKGYEYYGERVYSDLIQSDELPESSDQPPVPIPVTDQ
jgi:hypothetical protein